MASEKATLSVILKANELVVEESHDALLWRRVLAAIQDGNNEFPHSTAGEQAGVQLSSADSRPSKGGDIAGGDYVERLAARLGVERGRLEDACCPTTDAPYLKLNPYCWESMKKNLAARKAFSVAPIAVAGTILALWFDAAGLAIPTQSKARAVLKTINIEDKNPSRSIHNASWLRSPQGGQIVINSTEVSKAEELVKCFCTREWKIWKEMAKTS